MRDHPIVIIESDAARLRALVTAQMGVDRDQDHLHELDAELERALIAEPGEAPLGLISMNTRVRIFDFATGERREVVVVYPNEANLNAGRISVLAPLGTALLGNREGDEVEWVMPGGLRRLRVERVRTVFDDAVSRRREFLAAVIV